MKKSARGFTLIELLVVIAIISILAIIGITVFTSVQRNARDARRRADLDAIAKAMEVNKAAVGYVSLATNQFSSGAIPLLDPQGFVYCGNTTVNSPPSGDLTAISTATACTPSGASGYSPISATVPVPAGGATSWKICTWLESGVAHCKASAQ